MQQNVGTLDRMGRVLLASTLLFLAWRKPGKPGVIVACTAGSLLSSAASGYCPLYRLANINTVGKPI